MFENLLKRFQGIMLVFLVSLISLVFVLQFGGPQAEGCTVGGAPYAAKVYGTTITLGDFQAAYNLPGFNRQPAERAQTLQLKEHTLNGLIERTLLAREAREVGFDVSADDVREHLAAEGKVYFSLGIAAPDNYLPPDRQIPVPVLDREGNYDSEGAKRFVQYQLRRSISEFVDWQVEEMLAERMRQTVTSTVQVSSQEVWDAYAREREQAKLEYFRFSPQFYRETMQPTDDEIRAWMAAHAEDVDREYQANRHRYTGLEEQVRARHILIRAGEDASEEVRAAARARAEGLLARARAGEDFAALARDNSEDPGSAVRGGDLGYNPRGRMVGPFDEAQFALDVDAISDIVETRFGYHIIQVTGRREGDVPEDEAKRELAEGLYLENHSAERAQEAAREALGALRSGTTVEELDRQLRGRPAAATEGDDPGQEGDPEQGDDPPDGEEEEPHPLQPRVQQTEMFGRTGNPVRGPFDAGPMTRAAFDLTIEEPFPEEPLQLGQDWFVFRLVERQTATRDEFTEEVRVRLTNGLLRGKRHEALGLYIQGLRTRAEGEGAIRINEDVLRYGTDEEERGEGEGDDES